MNKYDVLTVSQVARVLQCSHTSARKMIVMNILPHHTLPGSKRRRVTVGDLQTMIVKNNLPRSMLDAIKEELDGTYQDSLGRSANGELPERGDVPVLRGKGPVGHDGGDRKPHAARRRASH